MRVIALVLCFSSLLTLSLGRQVAPAVEPVQPLPADQPHRKLLVGATYFHTLMDEIHRAEASISIMMYACVVPEDVRDEHPVKMLIEALAAAQQRGVDVRIILDREIRRDGSEDMINHRAALFMARHGLKVRRDEPDRRSHSKLIVIDEQRIVLGSANWTWSAFHRNREHSLWLADEVIAAQCQRDFNAVWKLTR